MVQGQSQSSCKHLQDYLPEYQETSGRNLKGKEPPSSLLPRSACAWIDTRWESEVIKPGRASTTEEKPRPTFLEALIHGPEQGSSCEVFQENTSSCKKTMFNKNNIFLQSD
ncbi:hypothetical protein Y1Q_0021890 [Alligator mississippiensis]|uniref:Uncharacterized protein n=1 Tax=Alligator mississippiensis TaxID=8496 RepID=A0A151M605_ALLMI|nr:hypothetical protein Y1Q_0021890 [Alligator mississippiensis]